MILPISTTPGNSGGRQVHAPARATDSVPSDDDTASLEFGAPSVSAPVFYPGQWCALQHANEQGVTGVDAVAAITKRCQKWSCPACSTFRIRKAVRRAVRASCEWCLSRTGVTLLFAAIPAEGLSVEVIQQHAQWTEQFADALRGHPQVVGFLVKMELDQASRGPGGVAMVTIHVHADVMTLCHSAGAVIKACMPAAVQDVQIEPKPDVGWIEYLGKPVVHPPAKKRDPAVLKAICAALDDWQWDSGSERLLWLGGLYTGHTARWACQGAGITKALADDSKWCKHDGTIRRIIARKWSRTQKGIKKWAMLAKYYTGTWKIDVLYGPKLRCRAKCIAICGIKKKGAEQEAT